MTAPLLLSSVRTKPTYRERVVTIKFPSPGAEPQTPASQPPGSKPSALKGSNDQPIASDEKAPCGVAAKNQPPVVPTQVLAPVHGTTNHRTFFPHTPSPQTIPPASLDLTSPPSSSRPVTPWPFCLPWHPHPPFFLVGSHPGERDAHCFVRRGVCDCSVLDESNGSKRSWW